MKRFFTALLAAILATARNWRLMTVLILLHTLLVTAGGATHTVSRSLLDAIEQVESSRNVKAVGDGGKAVGCMQIHTAVVDDVNRIYGKSYKYSDRTDRTKSREIAKLYLAHWGKHYTKKTGLKPTDQVLARIWNGGPSGWSNRNTVNYWQRVKKEISK